MDLKTSGFKKILNSLTNLFRSYRVLVFVLLILISLAYVAAVFYFYALNPKQPDQSLLEKTALDQKLYQKIMDNFQKRDQNFQEEGTKTYVDLFK